MMNKWIELCFSLTSEYVSQDSCKENVGRKYREIAEHFLNVLSHMKRDTEEGIRDDMAIINYVLAYVYSNVFFDYKKSLELYFDALNLYEGISSTDSVTKSSVYCNIGTTLSDMGRYSEAYDWHFKALSIREDTFGIYDEETAKSYYNITAMYFSMRDFDKAVIWGRKALNVRENVLGENHQDTAAALQLLADIYDENSEPEKALLLYERAFGILIMQHGVSSDTVSNKFEPEGDKPYEKALKSCHNTLELTIKELGEKNTTTAKVYNHMAFLYSQRNEHEEAIKYYFKALEIHEEILGCEHNFVAEDYNNIGVTYCVLGQKERGLEYCLRAVRIIEKSLGNKHPDTIALYESIAAIYDSMENDVMAKTYLE